MNLYILCTIFGVVVFGLEIIHHFERRDLYNRIMSGTLTEYKHIGKPPPQALKSAHRRVLDNWKKGTGGGDG